MPRGNYPLQFPTPNGFTLGANNDFEVAVISVGQRCNYQKDGRDTASQRRKSENCWQTTESGAKSRYRKEENNGC